MLSLCSPVLHSLLLPSEPMEMHCSPATLETSSEDGRQIRLVSHSGRTLPSSHNSHSRRRSHQVPNIPKQPDYVTQFPNHRKCTRMHTAPEQHDAGHYFLMAPLGISVACSGSSVQRRQKSPTSIESLLSEPSTIPAKPDEGETLASRSLSQLVSPSVAT